MPLKEDQPVGNFSRVQNNILRWALKDYQMSVETSTRGGYWSWLDVEKELARSSSYERVVANLQATENFDLGPQNAKSKVQPLPDDADRWSITGKKLERFVDGEKSRSTGLRKRQTPEVWVRCVLKDFLHTKGHLPEYFNDPGLEPFYPAFALAEFFSTSSPSPNDLPVLDFSGTYRERNKTNGENRPARLGFCMDPQRRFYEMEGSTSHRGKSGPKLVRGWGWATVMPSGSMIVFLQNQDEDEITHCMYFLHSHGGAAKNLIELRLLPYQGPIAPMVKSGNVTINEGYKYVHYINDIPKTFDRVPSFVKALRKRTPRGEAALKLVYDDVSETEECNMVVEDIDIEFQHAVCAGDVQRVQSLIDSVEKINQRIAGSGGTILHVIADEQLKDIFKIVRTRRDLNYLVKDNWGRLPSQVAMNSEEDVGLGTFLIKKEMQQARRDRIDYREFAMRTASRDTLGPTPKV